MGQAQDAITLAVRRRDFLEGSTSSSSDRKTRMNTEYNYLISYRYLHIYIYILYLLAGSRLTLLNGTPLLGLSLSFTKPLGKAVFAEPYLQSYIILLHMHSHLYCHVLYICSYMT